MIELIPKALHLHDGPMKTLGQNFRRNFNQVWKRLNPKTQKTIANYLKQHRGTAYLCVTMDLGNQQPYGRCVWGDGCTAITFSAPYFALSTSDDLRTAVIGHELAHVYRRGSGEWTADSEIEERDTRALALRWGYHPPTMRDEAHQTELRTIEAEWLAANHEYRNERESRWIIFAG